jgi:hypothetical protein
MWRLWCKALGEKASDDKREADNIAHIRTIIFCTYFITNLFIIAGVIRHWNDIPTERLPIQHQSIQEKHS